MRNKVTWLFAYGISGNMRAKLPLKYEVWIGQ